MMKISNIGLILVTLLLTVGCIAQKKHTDSLAAQLDVIHKELKSLRTTVYETQKTAALTLAGHCKAPKK